MTKPKQKKTTTEDEKYPEMRYYLNDELSDITFVVKGERLPANKGVLAFKSQVFSSQFAAKTPNKRRPSVNKTPKKSESEDLEIIINNTTPEAFKALLYFVHSDQLVLSDHQSLDIALDVYELSIKYHLKRMEECLEKHVTDNLINEETIVKIFAFANKKGLNGLIDRAKKAVKDDMKYWLAIDFKTLIELNKKTNDCFLEMLFVVLRDNFLPGQGDWEDWSRPTPA